MPRRHPRTPAKHRSRGVDTPMQRMKIIALGTVAALALAACGDSKDDAKADGGLDGAGKTLNVLVQANTIYPQQQKQFFTDTSNAFKAQTGAEVKFDTFA